MSSSGLIYAVIVGAWAAYLVPMWLRRQDELNEARPTERFSTAIRLLSGKAGMERRYAKEAERRRTEVGLRADDDDAEGNTPDGSPNAVDVRAFAEPKTMVHEVPAAERRDAAAAQDRTRSAQPVRVPAGRKAAERTKRAQVLARRRRTTMVLFLCFSVGAVVAAVGGVAFLWAPAVPAALLSAYIAHLRTQERRRFHVQMDRRRAEEAAARLREQRAAASSARTTVVTATEPPHVDVSGEQAVGRATAAPERDSAADRRVLVEQTDHAEWVDEERARVRQRPEGEGWDPVPVPLPTYVNAPVAPRTARSVDLDAPDAWSSARSTTAATGGAGEAAPPPAARRSGRSRERTPLFDQMADKERPRAANE